MLMHLVNSVMSDTAIESNTSKNNADAFCNTTHGLAIAPNYPVVHNTFTSERPYTAPSPSHASAASVECQKRLKRARGIHVPADNTSVSIFSMQIESYEHFSAAPTASAASRILSEASAERMDIYSHFRDSPPGEFDMKMHYDRINIQV